LKPSSRKVVYTTRKLNVVKDFKVSRFASSIASPIWIGELKPAANNLLTVLDDSLTTISDSLIVKNDTLCVGNDYNDLDMLNFAGHAFVVANAPEDMKSEFSCIKSNSENGVANIFKGLYY
jgi:hypothetical protein